jgi:DNA-binding winged helix-turn-helix (wHTH) protein
MNDRFPPVRSNSGEVSRFGIFELDLRRQELRRKGVRVPLQRQPFEILRLLVAYRGDFVSRDLIQKTLWPDGRFVDF